MVWVLAKCPQALKHLDGVQAIWMSQCGFSLTNFEQGISTCYKCQSIFSFYSYFCVKPEPTERLLPSAWTSGWLDVARWTGWRADGLRLHVGLSAGFISSHGLPANPFNYVHLPAGIMKRMSCAARYWQAEPTQTAPPACFVCLQLVSSCEG